MKQLDFSHLCFGGSGTKSFSVFRSECLDTMRTMDANTCDSLVTDPPAGIGFMGKEWDGDKGGRVAWVAWMTTVMQEAMRVLKPGAHGLVWAIPRTSHWTMTALEQAGFEVRDVITHLFGTGFPKSLDVSKAIDKAAGAARADLRSVEMPKTSETGQISKNRRCAECGKPFVSASPCVCPRDSGPATAAAAAWSGWGTALKPAAEFWILIRKPLSEKTVAANVLKYGTGAINIDAGRIETAEKLISGRHVTPTTVGPSGYRDVNCSKFKQNGAGRFPANIVLSHSSGCKPVGVKTVKAAGGNLNDVPATKRRSLNALPDSRNWQAHGNGDGTETVEAWECEKDCAVAALDAQSGPCKTGDIKAGTLQGFGGGKNTYGEGVIPREYKSDMATGASRFFYCSKASKADRGGGNRHPTVKSTKLMGYLIKLITPPGGIVLDPFMGSGSTGVAALREGFRFVGIEQETASYKTARERLKQ